MSLKNVAIGAGISYVILRNLRGMFTIIFLIILLCFFFAPEEPNLAELRVEIRKMKDEIAYEKKRAVEWGATEHTQVEIIAEMRRLGATTAEIKEAFYGKP